jgi:hypothetical protein
VIVYSDKKKEETKLSEDKKQKMKIMGERHNGYRAEKQYM